MADVELLPCPFCGAVPRFDGEQGMAVCVLCGECGASSDFSPAGHEREAAAAWNTRADILDTAYLAIGAAAALRELDDARHSALIDARGGELGVIKATVKYAELLGKLYNDEFANEFPGVWCYDVSEPLGTAIVNHMADDEFHSIDGETVRKLARELAAQV